MRDTQERPEGVEAGTLRLVGTEEENIYRNFKELLEDPAAYDNMSHACNPYVCFYRFVGEGFIWYQEC